MGALQTGGRVKSELIHKLEYDLHERMRLLLLSLILFPLTVFSQQGWNIFQQGKDFHIYYNSPGSALTERKFQESIRLDEHFLLVKENGKWWKVDSLGKLFPVPGDDIWESSSGQFHARIGNSVTALFYRKDQQGKSLDLPLFDSIRYLKNVDKFLVRKGMSYGLLTPDGAMLLPLDFQQIRIIPEGIAGIRSGKCVLLPKDSSSSISDLHFDSLNYSDGDAYSRFYKSGEAFLIGDRGWVRSDLSPRNVKRNCGDLIWLSNGTIVNSSGKLLLGYINDFGRLNDHLFYFLQGEQYGLINDNGKVVLKASCSRLQALYLSQRTVALYNSKSAWDVYDAGGKKSGTYQDVVCTSDYIVFKQKQSSELFTRKGTALYSGRIDHYFKPLEDIEGEPAPINRVAVISGDSIFIIDEGTGQRLISTTQQFVFYSNGIFGFTDGISLFPYLKNGTPVLPGKRINLISYFENGVFLLGRDQDTVMIGAEGKVIGRSSWSDVKPLLNGRFVARSGKRWFVVDDTGKELFTADSMFVMDRSAVAMRKSNNDLWQVWVVKSQSLYLRYFQSMGTYTSGDPFYSDVQYYGVSGEDSLYFSTDQSGTFKVTNAAQQRGLFLPLASSIQREQKDRICFSSKGGRLVDVDVPRLELFSGAGEVLNGGCTVRKEAYLSKGPIRVSFDGKDLFPFEAEDIRYKRRSVFEVPDGEGEKQVLMDHYVSVLQPDPMDIPEGFRADVFVPAPLIVKRNGKWGIWKMDGSLLADAVYDQIENFTERDIEYFFCRTGNKVKVISREGKMIREFITEMLLPVHSVNDYSRIGFVTCTKSSRSFITPQKNSCDSLMMKLPGFSFSKMSGGKYGFIYSVEQKEHSDSYDNVAFDYNLSVKGYFRTDQLIAPSGFIPANEKTAFVFFRGKILDRIPFEKVLTR